MKMLSILAIFAIISGVQMAKIFGKRGLKVSGFTFKTAVYTHLFIIQGATIIW